MAAVELSGLAHPRPYGGSRTVSHVFLTAWDAGDRIVVTVYGIAPGMRNSENLLRVTRERTGPGGLEDLLMDALAAVLDRYSERERA